MSAPKYDLTTVFDPAHTHPDDAHSQLMRLIPRHSRVLELGCATGYLSRYMEQSLACQVTGLEFDKASVQVASTRASAVYQVNLDLPDALKPAHLHAPFDVVLAAAVLEHLTQAQQVLRDLHPLLGADARLIVSLPNIAHWGSRLRLLRGRFDYTDYGLMDRTHVHFYTLRTGRQLLLDCGYQVTEVHIAGSGLQNLLNAIARRTRRKPPRPILANILAYELIYVAQSI